MSITEAKQKLKREIGKLNRAYADHAFKGCQPPEDWPYYEKQLKDAKNRVNNAIENLLIMVG